MSAETVKKKLAIKQEVIRKKELAIEKLLGIQLNDEHAYKELYKTRLNKLERHRTKADTLKTDLEDADTVANHKYHIKQYIDQIPDLLVKTDNDDQARMEIFENL